VRLRVIALADETLAALPDEDVPASLRAIRRFTPAKRVRLGAATLGAALDTEPAFRWAVAARVRDTLPALAAAVDSGAPAAAVSATDLAAVAYLLDAPDWAGRVEAVLNTPSGVEAHRATAAADQAGELAAARSDVQRLRRELTATRREMEVLRRQLDRAEGAVRRAELARDDAQQQVQGAEAERDSAERRLSAEARRLRHQLRDAQIAAAAARRGLRAGRDMSTSRLRVLLETITAASAGLRHELELPGAAVHPADLTVGRDAERPAPADVLATVRRGRSDEDPAVLDDVLGVPGMHLIVDGYNVTKLGYPTLSLEDQRTRLVSALTGLAARASGAELTCVFDATAAFVRPPKATPRGLRVLFSAVGELADQLIVRLVQAEPAGRPVVVVTNDREVIAAAGRAGAAALPSAALLARLERA
jgi:predicted RNA-binding protein with PIN domain